MKAEEIIDNIKIGDDVTIFNYISKDGYVYKSIVNAVNQQLTQKQNDIDELVEFIKSNPPNIYLSQQIKAEQLIQKHTKK